jgi:hypothetical protein
MSDSTTRLSRELETREQAKRTQAWTPPQLLPDPIPAEGFAYRWIRTATMGVADPTNTSAKFREGWVPVKAVDHPELQIHTDPGSTSRFKDNVEIGGLLLCKIPKEIVQQRKDHYARQAQAQMDAVDNNFLSTKDSKSNMSLFTEKKTEVSFGRGNKS